MAKQHERIYLMPRALDKVMELDRARSLLCVHASTFAALCDMGEATVGDLESLKAMARQYDAAVADVAGMGRADGN